LIAQPGEVAGICCGRAGRCFDLEADQVAIACLEKYVDLASTAVLPQVVRPDTACGRIE
jgi:hypothetical protein